MASRKETQFFIRLKDIFRKSVRASDLPAVDAAGKRLQQRHSATTLALWCGIDPKRMRFLKFNDSAQKEELAAISRKTGLSLSWLITGEGDPWAGKEKEEEQTQEASAERKTRETAQEAVHEQETASPVLMPPPMTPPPPPRAAMLAEMGACYAGMYKGIPAPLSAAVPSMTLLGLAACGMEGWEGRITYPISVPAPHVRQDMLAVLMYGTSLVPKGILDGHICFCDPRAEAQPGEVVYVEHKGGAHAILKEFLGYGVQGAAPDELVLRGWLPPEVQNAADPDGLPPRQKSFTLRLKMTEVRMLAPVVYVQRHR